MTFLTYCLFLCSLLTIHTTFAFPTAPTTQLCSVRQIYQFPLPNALENLAVRSNGNLLVTDLTEPNLYLIDPFSPNEPPTLLHTFPNALGLLGITEVTPDIFAVIVGNFTLQNILSPSNSYSIYLVDLQDFQIDDDASTAKVTKALDVPEASLLNGLVVLHPEEGILLSPDTLQGVVYLINIHSGTYHIAISDPLMKPLSPPAILGINGIKISGSTLYFTNTGQQIYASIPIHLSNGTAAGPSKIVAHSLTSTTSYDDFIIDERTGAVYLTTMAGDSIAQLTPSGKQTIIAGKMGSTEIAQPTAVRFGRTWFDKDTLYVTTGGGVAGPINGTIIVGGQVVAVDLWSCGL